MMLKDKKPSQVLAHLEGQGGKNPLSDGPSRDEFNTRGVPGQVSGRVSSLLGYGSANAVPATQLAELLGADVRSVREAVQRERLAGVPICAEGNGYFLPGDVSELVRFSRCIAHRARETQRVADAVRRSLDEMTGQTRMGEVVGDG